MLVFSKSEMAEANLRKAAGETHIPVPARSFDLLLPASVCVKPRAEIKDCPEAPPQSYCLYLLIETITKVTKMGTTVTNLDCTHVPGSDTGCCDLYKSTTTVLCR